MISRVFFWMTAFFLFSLVLTTYAFAAKKEQKMDNVIKRSVQKNADNSPFGSLAFLYWNHGWNNYMYPDQAAINKAVMLLKEAQVGWVRMDFLWQDIEPSKDQWDFSKYDYIVELLSRNNIKILGLLDYYADWASPKGLWNYPAEDKSLFIRYCLKTVERYHDKVKYWELWNEPDSNTYWLNQDGLISYCRLLKDVYTALKKTDPECKILNGGLASGLAGVNRLYDNGAKDYFDILNIHIFENPLNNEAIKRVTAYARATQKVMARNNDAEKEIWVTEIGCPGIKTDTAIKNWWMGPNPDEQTQAAWLEAVFKELLDLSMVKKVFWAFFQDTKKHWDNGVDYFGLLRQDSSKKPSFGAYKQAVRTWYRSR